MCDSSYKSTYLVVIAKICQWDIHRQIQIWIEKAASHAWSLKVHLKTTVEKTHSGQINATLWLCFFLGRPFEDNWWSPNEHLMMSLWSTDDHLMMNWWWTGDQLMTNWWSTDDHLMINWWSTDDQLMTTDNHCLPLTTLWFAQLYWTILNSQSYIQDSTTTSTVKAISDIYYILLLYHWVHQCKEHR